MSVLQTFACPYAHGQELSGGMTVGNTCMSDGRPARSMAIWKEATFAAYQLSVRSSKEVRRTGEERPHTDLSNFHHPGMVHKTRVAQG